MLNVLVVVGEDLEIVGLKLVSESVALGSLNFAV